MSSHEFSLGLTDEYCTPPEVMKALGSPIFDMDVAAPRDPTDSCVQARSYLCERGLETPWKGFVWCNPPYGRRGTKLPWVQKMIAHDNGLLLMPDRTSADWWQAAATGCDDFLTTIDKIKFVAWLHRGCQCKRGTVSVERATGFSGVEHLCRKCGGPTSERVRQQIKQPGTGNTIFAFGADAIKAIRMAETEGFGIAHRFKKNLYDTK
jgi:hypothetical protein